MSNRKAATRLLAGACVLALLGAAPQDNQEAITFNQAIANGNKRLQEAGVAFGEAIRPALGNQQVDLDRLRRTHKNALKVLEEVRKDVAAVKVPPSESGRNLRTGYERFLKGQEDAIKKQLAGIVRLIEKDNPPNQSTSAQILRILQEVGPMEAQQLKELQALQQTFAREHNIALRPADEIPPQVANADPTAFNNLIANCNKKLNVAGQDFGLAIKPALMNQAVNIVQVRNSYKNALKALETVKNDFAAARVPASDSARKLAKGYVEFLKMQEDAITRDFRAIVMQLEQNNNPGAAQILAILQNLGQREQTMLLELQAAQRAFAREHNITLKPAP
jgi:hypothetical protein